MTDDFHLRRAIKAIVARHGAKRTIDAMTRLMEHDLDTSRRLGLLKTYRTHESLTEARNR